MAFIYCKNIWFQGYLFKKLERLNLFKTPNSTFQKTIAPKNATFFDAFRRANVCWHILIVKTYSRSFSPLLKNPRWKLKFFVSQWKGFRIMQKQLFVNLIETLISSLDTFSNFCINL